MINMKTLDEWVKDTLVSSASRTLAFVFCSFVLFFQTKENELES